jgi:TonB-dependent receptor
VGGNMNGFKVLSPFKIYKAFETNPGWFVANEVNNSTRTLRDNWLFDEDIHSLYVSDDIRIGKLTLTPGIRYEYTDSTGRGAVVRSDTQATAASNGAAVNSPAWLYAKYGSTMTGGNTYGNALLYLHSNYKVSENLVFRGSVHSAITRADPANLIPGISSLDESARKLTASNPDLSAEKSVNVNLGAEYYFEPVGVFSVNVFHSTIKGLQYAGNTYVLGSDGFEGDTAYAGWTINQPFNIRKTLKRSGVEIDYSQQFSNLPGAFKGLGVFANATLLKYDEWAFYSTAKKMANMGVSYRLGRFSARLNGNWVGKSLWNSAKAYNQFTDVWTSAAPFTVEYQRARLQMDLNLEVKLHKHVTLYLDGRNILNEPSVYSYRGSEENFIRVLRTGSIWMMGVKGTF